MTLAAIAKELNVSTMTVYRKLRQNGLEIGDLRGEDGQITAEGASLIASLFDATQAATDDITQAKQVAEHDATEVAVLTERLNAAQETISRLENEVTRLSDQLKAMSAALEREQLDRANERLLLTAGNAEEPRTGSQRKGPFWWFHRNRG